jgi:hypothetical protein
MPLAWGKSVSADFRKRTLEIAEELGCEPSHLMAVMAFESARTFKADVRNAAGSGATGLIQFMPQTAAALGTTTAQLARMSAVNQLGWVRKYLLPFKGRLKTLEDLYMAILWPVAVGKANSFVLFRKDDPKRPKLYIQNAGLDFNKDGLITKREAAGKVRDTLAAGLKPPFVLE